jgi:hypothetical protein
MKTVFLICALLLMIAVFDLPIKYYTFLRIIITIGALTALISEMKNDVNLWGITFIFVAIIFNPFIPIYLYQKTIWIPIDISTALLFLIYGFKDKTKP